MPEPAKQLEECAECADGTLVCATLEQLQRANVCKNQTEYYLAFTVRSIVGGQRKERSNPNCHFRMRFLCSGRMQWYEILRDCCTEMGRKMDEMLANGQANFQKNFLGQTQATAYG